MAAPIPGTTVTSSAALPQATLTDEKAPSLRWIVTAACLGTVIEYYDFSIYTSLAIYLAANFFPKTDPGMAVLLAVASTGVAFLARPFGGLVFGYLGDMIGRKFAFMATLLMMGLATIAMGVVPSYASIGIAATAILIALRVVQGLAAGGEYAAAMTYVIEHCPDNKRGFYTGWLASMGTASILFSLIVVLITRKSLGTEAFEAWGWRLPFLFALVMLMFAMYFRMRLRESPVFTFMKKHGKGTTNPLRDIFTNRKNLLTILVAGIGISGVQITAGATAGNYILYFLQTILHVDADRTTIAVSITNAVTIVMMISFAAWSDTVGRRRIMQAGMVLALVTYLPLFWAIEQVANWPSIIPLCLVLCLLNIPTAMLIGPGFVYSTEVFPARIRTSSFALSFSLGGIIGGFAPSAALGLTNWSGSIYVGLSYALVVFLLALFINVYYLSETNRMRLWDELLAPDASALASTPASDGKQ